MTKKTKFAVVAIAVAIIAVIGCLIGFNGSKETISQQEEVKIFYLKSDETEAVLSPVLRKIKGDDNKYVEMLQELFDGPDTMSGFTRVFPNGSAALNVTIDEYGVATVDLNQRSTELNVGAEGEWLAIISIVNTLATLPEIEKVQFLVEGNSVETLVGHVDLTKTFEYDEKAVGK